MDFSSANTALWAPLIQLGIIAMLILVANVLRRKIAFIRNSLMPTAVLAGFLMLLLRNIGFEVIDVVFLEGITYHAIALGFIALALIGNVLVYKLHLGTDACQPGDNLSMFYLSPYYPTQFPLLGAVQEFSYPLFVLIYVIIFTALSLLVWKVANIAWKRVKAKV